MSENSDHKNNSIIQEIKRLKRKKGVLILAHIYQIAEIQHLADIVGDSLGLAKAARNAKADIIVFCGVKFMAETAKILNPTKKVIIPTLDAGCPMARMATAQKVEEMRDKYPEAAVVTYVNSTAEVKAVSDITCTSSNAIDIVKSLPNKQIIFVPDKNLGHYVAQHVPEKEIVIWKGFCRVHNMVKLEELNQIKRDHPKVKILVHPECSPEIVSEADYAGSTAQIVNYVKNSQDKEFIIGTEEGILTPLQDENPNKRFYLLSPNLLCVNMKRITLQALRNSLISEQPEITVPSDIALRAEKAINRMMDI
ncbi:MAG: quinolinate synthase NadA [Promethearchaeota archaeon]